MKKFLFACIGLMIILAAQAATYDVGVQQTQSEQVLLMQSDAQTMAVDFVYANADCVTYTIAITAETECMRYKAEFADVRKQVFDLTMPVFRLCRRKANAFKSNLYTGWRGINSNPPSQYDRR